MWSILSWYLGNDHNMVQAHSFHGNSHVIHMWFMYCCHGIDYVIQVCLLSIMVVMWFMLPVSLLHTLQGDEWRLKLMQDRLSQHIARCPPGANCEDRVCKYVKWFQRHYDQCVQRGTVECVTIVVCAKMNLCFNHWLTHCSSLPSLLPSFLPYFLSPSLSSSFPPSLPPSFFPSLPPLPPSLPPSIPSSHHPRVQIMSQVQTLDGMPCQELPLSWRMCPSPLPGAQGWYFCIHGSFNL